MSHSVKRFESNTSNFSIDHILNVAGGKPNLKGFEMSKAVAAEGKHFEWLNCTRYRPPKLPRQIKKEGIQKRKLGRNPRIPFSSSQVALLEAKFLRTPYLSSGDVANLASYLKLSETRVKIWFQNRRARERREKESKSRAKEKSPKAEPHVASLRPTAILPLDLARCFRFPLASSGPLGRSPYTEPMDFLQIIPPLDLSERQMLRRPK